MRIVKNGGCLLSLKAAFAAAGREDILGFYSFFSWRYRP